MNRINGSPPAIRIGIDLGGDRVLVVGSATMTIEQVIAAASAVTVSRAPGSTLTTRTRGSSA